MSLDQNSGVMNLGWPRPGDLEEGLFLFIDLSRYCLVLLLPKAGKSVKKGDILASPAGDRFRTTSENLGTGIEWMSAADYSHVCILALAANHFALLHTYFLYTSCVNTYRDNDQCL